MKDKSGKTEQAQPETSGPVGGERLRLARRENDISVGDIAKELHLDEPKVRALEKNEFDALGAPVFAKGHLRKYAELVGIGADEIMSDYYQMNRSVGAPPVVGPKRKLSSDVWLGPWIGGILLLASLVGAGYWWFTRETPPELPAVEPATLAPFSSDSDLSEDADAMTAADLPLPESDETIADDPIGETADEVIDAVEPVADPVTNSVAAVSESISAPPSDLPQVEVVLTYSGDCWTEVSDASDRRLFYDLGQAGRTITLTGDSPLRVVLGDSANVSISVDGSAYTIPTSARTGRLARLTLSRR